MMELHICARNGGKVLRKFALGDLEELIIGRDEDRQLFHVSIALSNKTQPVHLFLQIANRLQAHSLMK
jgi:hypothetical protein